MKQGMKVKLRHDVLRRHARSVPEDMGYTREQFQWRDTLRRLSGEEGEVTHTFEDSTHVNVTFHDGTTIGICHKDLELIHTDVDEIDLEHYLDTMGC